MAGLNNKSFEEFKKEQKFINADIVWEPQGSKQKIRGLSILSTVFPNKKITLECWYLSKYNDFAFNIMVVKILSDMIKRFIRHIGWIPVQKFR